MEWVTTTTLLHELRDFDNRTAWDRFVARFRQPVVDFARRMGLSAEDAQDVAQETLVVFAEAFRGGRYDRERGRLRSWLFGIAYRRVLKQRDRGARAAAEPLREEGAADPKAAEDLWNREWDRIFLEECLGRARRESTPATFRAFELVVLQGRPPAEAAVEMGVPLKKVYNAKHRVLARMRELRSEIEGPETDAGGPGEHERPPAVP